MKRTIISWFPLIILVISFYFVSEYHVASIHYNIFLLSLIFSAFLIVGIYMLFPSESGKDEGESDKN